MSSSFSSINDHRLFILKPSVDLILNWTLSTFKSNLKLCLNTWLILWANYKQYLTELDKLILRLFFCDRSSTSEIIRVYDYFGLFACRLNTEHQPDLAVLSTVQPKDVCVFHLSSKSLDQHTLYRFIFMCSKKLKSSRLNFAGVVVLTVSEHGVLLKIETESKQKIFILGFFSSLVSCSELIRRKTQKKRMVSVWCQKAACVMNSWKIRRDFPLWLS